MSSINDDLNRWKKEAEDAAQAQRDEQDRVNNEGKTKPDEEYNDIKAWQEEQYTEMKVREDEAMASMENTGMLAQNAIDRQLGTLLEQAGFASGETRKSIGAASAAQGLGRSGFNVQRLASQREQELEVKGQYRNAADTQKRTVAEQINTAKEGVIDRRMEIRNKMAALEASGMQEASLQAEMSAAKEDYMRLIDSMEASAASKTQLLGFLAGTMGGIGFAAGSSGGSDSSSGDEGGYEAESYPN